MNLISQIDKLIKIEDKNSDKYILELNKLNTEIAESELGIKQIKHLPSTIDKVLLDLKRYCMGKDK